MNGVMPPGVENPLVFSAISAGIGAIVGSFLGVVCERVPGMVLGSAGRENLWLPGSHCPQCGHTLAWWENIPLLSWCLLGGRCRQCRNAIPLRLLMVELLSALFFAASSGFFPTVSGWLPLWILWCGLLPLAMIDSRHMLLPDCLTQPLLWAGLLTHAVFHTLPVTDALFGAAAGYAALWLIYQLFRLSTGREGLGYGDIKLLAALGAWCGWQVLPLVLLSGAILGIIGYFVLYKPDNASRQIPFGPFLSCAGIGVFILQSAHIAI
ncbi:prepilin peptidase [Entomohabitans teleogrylli]|uniref:prepilin peptidase n=1 Tax=Entomohabitans teleogrylli TaxID=1384589 RepID=UPI00073D4002|nr:A24 family peptidase [Entomohabitans teleogrylli]